MPLSEEDRRRIYEEEKERLDAERRIKSRRQGIGCLTVLGFFALLSLLGKETPRREPSTESSSTPAAGSSWDSSPARAGATFRLTLERVTYEYGYFKVVGTATNEGDGAAFSPTILLQVFDSKTGQTLLAQDLGWPAGTYLARMQPSASAAFQLSAAVPGEPGGVQYRVSMKDFTYVVDESRLGKSRRK